MRNSEGSIVNLHVKSDGQPFMSSPTCTLHLFGEDKVGPDKPGPFYLCEGPWDMAAMQQLLTANKKPGVVVAVPGAAVFKQEWSLLFPENATIYLLYDNDNAGTEGMKRAAKILRDTGNRTISSIRWPATVAEGYDLNDFYA